MGKSHCPTCLTRRPERDERDIFDRHISWRAQFRGVSLDIQVERLLLRDVDSCLLLLPNWRWRLGVHRRASARAVEQHSRRYRVRRPHERDTTFQSRDVSLVCRIYDQQLGISRYGSLVDPPVSLRYVVILDRCKQSPLSARGVGSRLCCC